MRHLERRVRATKRELAEQRTKWSEANEVLVHAGDARGIGISLWRPQRTSFFFSLPIFEYMYTHSNLLPDPNSHQGCTGMKAHDLKNSEYLLKQKICTFPLSFSRLYLLLRLNPNDMTNFKSDQIWYKLNVRENMCVGVSGGAASETSP